LARRAPDAVRAARSNGDSRKGAWVAAQSASLGDAG